jgi:hypothetical protein
MSFTQIYFEASMVILGIHASRISICNLYIFPLHHVEQYKQKAFLLMFKNI